ncbi:MAG: DUF2339 domain-containing protein, partial [bacterium]|nr:DUF2339 domain-containing protein [bacterium]
LEVRTTWHPVAWVIGAFLLFFPGHLLKERISRFRFYALFLYWAGTFHIILVSLTNQSTSLPVTHQYRFSILLALVLQLGFILMFYRMAALETVRFSPPVTAFGAWLDTVRQRHHLWLLYPYFLATAFFLYWNFDRSVLTLFWVVEIFAIFTLSILFRENHFRYTAMIGLGACLIRLIFYDLARSDTLTRAMVFLGVGILMILMNSLYNKYRHRFRDD